MSDTQYRGGRPKSQQKFQAQQCSVRSGFLLHLLPFEKKLDIMADHHEEDELAPTQTAGYKVGEKKTMEEYQSLDANDESLKKWKQSLGLGGAGGKYSKNLLHTAFLALIALVLSEAHKSHHSMCY